METKKISFGFSKSIKKSSVVLPSKVDENPKSKIELISCVEGHSIKLVDTSNEEPEKPLVIPMVEKTVTSKALASLKLRQDILNGITEPIKPQENNNPIPVNLNETIEMRAAREILEATQKQTEEDVDDNTLTLPVKSNEPVLEGAVEATLDDYENIPITKFGLAMLRGMGWKDQPKKDKPLVDESPVVRPKGMGLGADKVIKRQAALVPPEPNEILAIKKNAFVRILAGKQKDQYGQIEGMDEHAGRVIVKLAIGGTRESLNEFMVQPVSKREYSQYGKVINSAKYDEYKKMENEFGQIIIKKEKLEKESSKDNRMDTFKEEEEKYSRSKYRNQRNDNEHQSQSAKSSRSRKYSSDSEDRHRQQVNINKEKLDEARQRHDNSRRSTRSRSVRSVSSNSSQSSYEHRSKKKSSKSKKNKSRERSKYRHSSSEDEKRHKKKTKRSKRPRSRSRGRR